MDPFNPYDLEVNSALLESQHAIYFPSTQPVYHIKMPFTVDLTVEESKKDKAVEEDDLWKLVILEEMIRVIEGTNFYDLVKAIKMCLVPNVVIPKKFRMLEFIKYIGTQYSITHLKA